MNRIIVTGLAAVAASAALGAAPAAAQRTDVVLGMQIQPEQLDPRINSAVAIGEVIYDNVMQGLVRFDQDGTILPSLAHDWTISPDGLIYTFHLREGVTYHDGSAFDADDVVFSIGALAPPDSANVWASLYAAIETVEAVDPQTVEITLWRPDSDLLTVLAWPQAVIYAAETSDQAGLAPIGTGPYRLTAFVENDRAELLRYEDYWGELPPLAAATIRFPFDDPAVAVNRLLAGDIDGFANFPAYANIPQFEANPAFEVVIGTTEGETMLITNNARAPFDDPLVRQAIAHAIDRDLVIDSALFGLGVPIGSHFSPLHPAFIDLTDTYPFNPQRARDLLAEAGHPNGFDATLKLPPTAYAREGGEVVAQLLRAVGIRLQIIDVPTFSQWYDEAIIARDYDLTIVAHAEPLDIGIYANPDYYFGYQSDRFNAVYAELKATLDEDARIPLYQELQRILAEDAVHGFLFELPKVGVWNADLQGMWENAVISANILQGLSWAE
jgi:peptide/nickel transport system substrate-binding protein